MPTTPLSPHLAGKITRVLLEYDATNRKRQMVDELMDSGVTQELYQQWRALRSSVEMGLSDPLINDITNLFSCLGKGTHSKSDELVQITDLSIRRTEQRVIEAQRLVLEKSIAQEYPVVPTFNVRLEAGMHQMHSNRQFKEAEAYAKTLPHGQYTIVTIERAGLYTNSPAEPTRYGAWVSNADGSATFVDKGFPASRVPLTSVEIATLHQSATRSDLHRHEKIAAASKVRVDLIEAKKLRIGAQWAGAATYVEGKVGMTAFSNSKIVDISKDGFISVESTLRGSNRLYKFAVDGNSRLFDNYPTLQGVLAQQERDKNAVHESLDPPPPGSQTRQPRQPR